MTQKILLIIDDEGKAEELNNTLSALGCATITVEDAVSGIEQAKQFVPEAIVLGLIFSNDGGLAVLERLKISPETRFIPIVMFMAIDTEDYRAKVDKLGVQTLIPKPYHPKAVGEEIRKLRKKDPSIKKILVVDDDAMLVRMLDSRLSASGYEVVALTDSSEAVHKIHMENPDLIVTDIMMPNVSGWQITQEIKGSPEYKKIPIILLSSLIEKEGKGQGFEIGDYFMSKPVMMDQLIAKIRELLGQGPS